MADAVTWEGTQGGGAAARPEERDLGFDPIDRFGTLDETEGKVEGAGDEAENPFNTVEIIMGVFFTGTSDALAAIIDFTGIGLALAPIIQSFTSLAITWWFSMKGDASATQFGRQAVRYAANVLPVVPTNLAAFVIEAYVHNHPEKFRAVTQTAAMASGKVGS